jgi:hypothetical protein
MAAAVAFHGIGSTSMTMFLGLHPFRSIFMNGFRLNAPVDEEKRMISGFTLGPTMAVGMKNHFN